METLVMVCAAVIIQCATPVIENDVFMDHPLNSEEDLRTFVQAIIKCQYTCPKKCLTKFIKRDKNSYWAICGGEGGKEKN